MMGKERNAFTKSIIIVDRYKTFVKSGQPCIYCGSIDTGLHLFSLQKEGHHGGEPGARPVPLRSGLEIEIIHMFK